ncbi:XRE family transcriptional regulator [Halomonas denitrificans]|uniref:XRE family transcriptional regulator n=1 Tax=Halomonas denitrificans TaxID=370769 RepID=UPI001CD1F9DE|nr:XRE family transcriptional regulator [Halomonas denitrificans]MCA0973978.1 XRE family transcriptional regulator [Halomonas denitrificans]
MSFEIREAMNAEGYISADALPKALHITKSEFARAIGLSQSAIVRKERLQAVSTQQRLRQAYEILKRIEPWAGSISAAWSWFRSYPIAALGDMTAEELVRRGRADDVRAYLSHIAEGGYA